MLTTENYDTIYKAVHDGMMTSIYQILFVEIAAIIILLGALSIFCYYDFSE